MTEADDRVVLHVDMDAFFASVEQNDNPALRGKPVIVGAPPDKRGVVAAASYEARVYGVRSAMPSREAGRRCPHAVFLPPNMPRYLDVSRQVVAIFESFTPLVEPISIDEAFLDVTGSLRLFGPAPQLAALLRQKIRAETGLTASVGVASNKFLAKLASELNKPDGLTVVPRSPGAIQRFLAPLPVSRIWGVGKVTQNNLEQAGIRTIGDLQQATVERLIPLVGKHAAVHLQRLAWGRDERELELEREDKSISREHTFDQDTADVESLRRVLCDLVEDVGRGLRESGRHAAVVRLKVRWSDFKTITRQKALAVPICDDISLREAAQELFGGVDLIAPVRLIGFGASHLRGAPQEQLSLFEGGVPARTRKENLSRAVDDLRGRLGPQSIGRAREPGA